MKIESENSILSVSQLTKKIKLILEKNYRFVRICGEISNLKTPYSGHSYFSLKDESAQIRAVLFKQRKRFIDLKLEDGQEVVCFGRITVYEPRGEYQLVVDSVELFGRGQLQLAFEQLKKKLETLGYFAAEHKKKIPDFPTSIAVISSPTGAAIEDFIKIFKLRNSSNSIQLLPVRVQGAGASTEIARAIKTINRLKAHEIIVICRGGGSIEDLWAFNEKEVAEAIFHSELPVVTGIGHEVDFTIADFCADLRCATPTGAAEKLAQDNIAVQDHLWSLRHNLEKVMHTKLSAADMRLHHQTKMLCTVTSVLKDAEHRLTLGKSYLVQEISNILDSKMSILTSLKSILQQQAPLIKIEMRENRVMHLKQLLIAHIKNRIELSSGRLGHQAALLNSVSPLATLGRGYSITTKYDHKLKKETIVRHSDDVERGDSVEVLLQKGKLACKVTDKS